MERFDVFVLGSGPAGGKIAAGLARAGLAVGLADDPIGGTCALRGCNPKKVLVAQADLVERCRHLTGKGLAADSLRLAWPDLIRFKREFTDPVPDATTKGLREAGVTVLVGHGRFTGPRTLAVGDTAVEADHVVVATGATPVPLPFPGSEHVITSTEFLELDALPERIVFVGAGYVAAELAGVAHTAGAHVALLEMTPRILPAFDPEHAAKLAGMMRTAGLDLRLGHRVDRVERDDDGFAVHTEHDGETATVACDLVVHGAGRRPNIADLDLAAAGVSHDAAVGIAVDDDLRSTANPRVLAAGDCAATDLWPLTPAAEHEARIVIETILHGQRRRALRPVLPSVAFTLPPIARVGMLASEAHDRGIAVRVEAADMDRWSSTRKVGGQGGAYRVVIDRGTGLILGAHLLGPGAEETINLFALAMEARLPADQLKDVPFTFPTFASNVPNMV